MVFTRKQLGDMKKDELVELSLQLQTSTDSSIDLLTKEIKDLKIQFQNQFDELNNRLKVKMAALKSELDIAKNTSFLLEKRCISLEQYSRRECLEVRGVPDAIQQDGLLEYLNPIFKEINCEITDPKDIQAIHRLRNRTNDVIIKFTHRDQRNALLTSRKNLKELDMEKLGIDENTKLFINESLSRYSKHLVGIANVLKKRKLIDSFWTINGNVRMKYHENDANFDIITHVNDFIDRFPQTDFENIFPNRD